MATKQEMKQREERLIERLNRHGQQLFEAKELIQSVACLMTRFPIRYLFPAKLKAQIDAFLSK